MDPCTFDGEFLLNRYILDYMLKNNMAATAEVFKTEAKVDNKDGVAINDSRQGFLSEWWSFFWDVSSSRKYGKLSETNASCIQKMQKMQQMQQMQKMQKMQQMQRMQRMQIRNPSRPPRVGSIDGISSEGMVGLPSASLLSYQQPTESSSSIPSESSPALFDAMSFPVSRFTLDDHQEQLEEGNSVNITTPLQQTEARTSLDTENEDDLDALEDLILEIEDAKPSPGN